MIARLRSLHRDDEAQAVVEFALTLPIFALLLLGLVEFGFLVNTKQELEGVARQGARTFALTGDGTAMVAAIDAAGRQLPGFAARTTLAVDVTTPDHPPTHALYAAGRLSGIAIPPGLAKRTEWVSVTVTYDFADPVQASVLGRHILPPSIPLATTAVARMETDQP